MPVMRCHFPYVAADLCLTGPQPDTKPYRLSAYSVIIYLITAYHCKERRLYIMSVWVALNCLLYDVQLLTVAVQISLKDWQQEGNAMQNEIYNNILHCTYLKFRLHSHDFRGHSRSFKPVPFESLGEISYLPSIVTMALSCIICQLKWDIGRKSWLFHTPCHSAPRLGGSTLEYRHPVWCGKTRMVGLPDGEKTLKIRITV